MKLGYIAQRHATVVAKNIKLLMKGGKEKESKGLSPYKRGSAITVVSLGRKNAVGQLLFMTVSGRLPAMFLFKSKDLFLGWTRKVMGLHP